MSVTLDLATCIELNGKIERYQSKGDDDVDKLLDILSALQEADAKGKLQVSMLRRCCSAPASRMRLRCSECGACATRRC